MPELRRKNGTYYVVFGSGKNGGASRSSKSSASRAGGCPYHSSKYTCQYCEPRTDSRIARDPYMADDSRRSQSRYESSSGGYPPRYADGRSAYQEEYVAQSANEQSTRGYPRVPDATYANVSAPQPTSTATGQSLLASFVPQAICPECHGPTVPSNEDRSVWVCRPCGVSICPSDRAPEGSQWLPGAQRR